MSNVALAVLHFSIRHYWVVIIPASTTVQLLVSHHDKNTSDQIIQILLSTMKEKHYWNNTPNLRHADISSSKTLPKYFLIAVHEIPSEHRSLKRVLLSNFVHLKKIGNVQIFNSIGPDLESATLSSKRTSIWIFWSYIGPPFTVDKSCAVQTGE